jgi:hypothetical protein
MEETKKEISVDDGTVDIELGEDTEAQSVEIDVVETGEHEEYSQGVKKRIDRLTKKMREAERQREEALLYAKNVKTESDQVKAKLNTVDQGYLNEYGGRITAESTAAKEAFKRAIAVGDPEGTLAAQTKLNELHYAETKLNEAKRAQTLNVQRQEQERQQPQPQQPQPQQPQPQQPQQAPQEAPAKADPRAEKWAGTNEWFGNDNTMTFAAYGIHKQLVDEAFDPTGDDYYDELDKRIREEFPHKFSDTGNKRRNAQTVVGVSRSNSSKKGRRQVKLSPSQVAIATKLGVPLEEYAKYVK